MQIIGMVHLKTLPGYPQHTSIEEVMLLAVAEAKTLEEGGVDAILVENSFDDPHQKYVAPEIIAAFTRIADAIRKAVNVPIGICVLWNDYKASLAIAKVVGGSFVRVPIFTEAVVTASGIIEGSPYDVISYRQKIRAGNIKIMADIQVKHAAPIAPRPIEESAREATAFGADEIIVTGRYTGDCPAIDDLQKVRAACPSAMLVIGSGTDDTNYKELALYADKAIVGTYFKPQGIVVVERVRKLVSLRDGA